MRRHLLPIALVIAMALLCFLALYLVMGTLEREDHDSYWEERGLGDCNRIHGEVKGGVWVYECQDRPD